MAVTRWRALGGYCSLLSLRDGEGGCKTMPSPSTLTQWMARYRGGCPCSVRVGPYTVRGPLWSLL